MSRIALPLGLALAAAIPLTSCKPGASSAETQQTPDGLRVKALDAAGATEDVIKLLGVELWRFDVALSPRGQAVELRLEAREKGKPSRRFGGMLVCTMRAAKLPAGTSRGGT